MVAAKRIKWLREQEGLSQKQLAGKLGLTLNGYQKIEYGDREPKIDILLTLSRLYEVSVDFLLGESDHTNKLQRMYNGIYSCRNATRYLNGEMNNTLMRRFNSFDDEEYKNAREGIELAIISFQNEFDYQLRDYLMEYVLIPEFDPSRNEVTMEVFPVKFKLSEEYNGNYTIRVIVNGGRDLASLSSKRYRDYEETKELVELLNSKAMKYWPGGIEPEDGDIQKYLF